MTVQERVIEVLRRVLALKDGVSPTLSRDDCASWDSLKHVEVLVSLEEEFDIRFEVDEVEALNSVTAIVRIVESRS